MAAGRAIYKVDGKEVTIVLEREEGHQRKEEKQGVVILRGNELLPHLVVDEGVEDDKKDSLIINNFGFFNYK